MSATRSPLPEGYPRAPLQDITHVLSPLNILPDHEGGALTELGQCRHGSKRPKCGADTLASTTCTARSDCERSASEWRGLRKCVALLATNNDVEIAIGSSTDGTSNTGPLEEAKHLTASTELTGGAETTSAVEIKEEALLHRDMADTEMLKLETEETSKSARLKPKRPGKLNASGPATRASLRSSSDKQKMSSLMKFR